MDSKTEKQMAKMVDAVQPMCDEPILAAMTCSHSGSMKSVFFSRLLGAGGGNEQSIRLPNPVFIAVGEKTIFAFDFAPRGFNYKFKREVARWPRDEIRVEARNSSTMAALVLTTNAGESFHLEIPTMMGGRELVNMFFESLCKPES